MDITITEPYTRYIHFDMLMLGYEDGLKARVKVRHNNMKKLTRVDREERHMQHMLRRTGAPIVHTGNVDAPSRECAQQAKLLWWNGSGLAASNLAAWAQKGVCIDSSDDEHTDEDEDDDDGGEPDATNDERAGGDEPWEGWDFIGTTKSWRRELTLRAQRVSALEWASARAAYEPTHKGCWAGSSMLWCHLHNGDEDDTPEWRPIGLELLHVGMGRELRCNMIRLWAGVTPSLRAYRLVASPSLNARSLEYKDEWVGCPCGTGPQDCMHVLTCTHTLIQNIRCDATLAAKSSHAPTTSQKRRAVDTFDWEEHAVDEQVALALGAYRGGISATALSFAVSAAAPHWAKLESAWAEINLLGGDIHKAGT